MIGPVVNLCCVCLPLKEMTVQIVIRSTDRKLEMPRDCLRLKINDTLRVISLQY